MDNLLVSCTEQLAEIDGQVEGTIPEWLSVQMLRVGPAKWDLDDFVLNHWLDGCAMLCKFTISQGRVKMNSKYLHSEAYNKMNQVKRPVFTEFGTRSYPDPCKNVFSRFFSQIVPSDLTDNGCVGIFKLANEYYSSSETCNVLKVCNHSLNVQQKINLDKVAGVNLACSHVQSIKGDDYAYNMSSSFLTGLKYHVLKIPLFKDTEHEGNNSSFMNRASILGSIPSSWKTCIAYYHSFAITANYLVFIELPLVVNAFKLATCTAKGKPLKDCLEWHPSENTRFHVICKRSGQSVGKYYAKAFFYFHTINAYEDNGHIVADLMAYEDPTILEKWDLSAMRSNVYDDQNQATPTRFVMPLHVQHIPLSRFFFHYQGYLQDSQVRLEPDLIRSVGILVHDLFSGPFRLEIDYIGFVYDSQHNDIIEYETHYHEASSLKSYGSV
ncbi:PREDICTED: beta,beta-carotene 9',10'-oxygenase-like [Rhagoletis zephyria]|uniref:beta,beta-carotene 9',10'-oxygenase-like n=1 Tax=Rhagoletis zephyria TaxID=28612 RepID=UPI000811274D|nr:PREDICTED: beta,beta-carotene 9',10'-oxygenase-like [Rhagoletis zephyria]